MTRWDLKDIMYYYVICIIAKITWKQLSFCQLRDRQKMHTIFLKILMTTFLSTELSCPLWSRSSSRKPSKQTWRLDYFLLVTSHNCIVSMFLIVYRSDNAPHTNPQPGAISGQALFYKLNKRVGLRNTKPCQQAKLFLT